MIKVNKQKNREKRVSECFDEKDKKNSVKQCKPEQNDSFNGIYITQTTKHCHDNY